MLDDNADDKVQINELTGTMASMKPRFADLDVDKDGGLDKKELAAGNVSRATRPRPARHGHRPLGRVRTPQDKGRRETSGLFVLGGCEMFPHLPPPPHPPRQAGAQSSARSRASTPVQQRRQLAGSRLQPDWIPASAGNADFVRFQIAADRWI